MFFVKRTTGFIVIYIHKNSLKRLFRYNHYNKLSRVMQVFPFGSAVFSDKKLHQTIKLVKKQACKSFIIVVWSFT